MSEESIAIGSDQELPQGSQKQIDTIQDLLRGDEPKKQDDEQQSTRESVEADKGEAAPPRESAQPDGDKQEETGDGAAFKAPTSLDELVEATGLSAEEFYALAVPMGDEREPLTVGALKDLATQEARSVQAEQQLEDQRTSFENEMIRARQELQQVITLLGPDRLTPQLIAQARQALTQQIDADREALAMAKPEWRDPEVFRAAQDEMAEAVSDYGFTRNDLAMIIDHRLTKLVYDFAKLKQRVTKADEGAKEIRKGLRRVRSAKAKEGDKGAKTGAKVPTGDKAARDRRVTELVNGALSE